LKLNLIFHGDGKNRWFDKLQIIVCKNGRAGLNMEHSGFDGHTLLVFSSNIFSDHLQQINRSNTSNIPIMNTNIPKITHQKLFWSFNDFIKNGIINADKKFQEFCKITDLFVLKFEGFGKLFITRSKFSPDAFVQLSYQLAYKQMMGVVGQTYESVLTKQFLHGRTETGRPCTPEACEFVTKFFDTKEPNENKMILLKKASIAHIEELRLCKNGFGVDRHLFAIKNIALREQKKNPNFKIPLLYSDPSYSIFKTDMMSTSNCGEDDSLDLFGFGPTSDSGFGIGYVVKDNSMVFNITHFKGRATEYGKHLEQSLLSLRDLIEHTN